MTFQRPLMVFLNFALFFAVNAGADDWPGVRGPGFDGVVQANGLLAESGDVELQVAWKIDLGSGYSSVAVDGDRLVTAYATATASEGGEDVLAAFDARDGKKLWSRSLGPVNPGHDGSHDGPVATPAIADGRVFFLAPSGEFLALDLETGNEIWSVHLADKHQIQIPMYGFGSSPIVIDGVLIAQMGPPGKSLVGLDPANGEQLWAVGDDVIFYQTPTPMTLGGRRQVVGAGLSKVFSVDPKNGELLWEWDHGGSGARGALSLVPVESGDGRIFFAHQDDASVMIQVSGGGESRYRIEKLWEGRAIRNSFNVPTFYEDHFYTYTSRFLTCVDAATGEARWRSRPPGDGFLILVDGKLVIVTKNGDAVIAEATPEAYRPLASQKVFNETVWSPPSFAGGAIYARSLGELARIDIRRASDTTMAATAEGPRLATAGEPPADSEFAKFLTTVREAPNKKKAVESYLVKQESFPILEQESLVHFVYYGEAADVVLVGDVFGGRTERSMSRLDGTDLFYASLELPSNARVNYRFVVDFEELTDPRNPRRVEDSHYKADMEAAFSGDGEPMSWFAMPGWQEAAHLAPSEGPRGRLEEDWVRSKHLGERIPVRVYLPPDYTENEKYPTAYVHAGGPLLRYGTITNSLDNLINAEKIVPLIVVFLGEPAAFGLDIIPRLPAYEKTFIEDIIPFIDWRYRTIATPASRANIGQALYALHSFYFTLKYRDYFEISAAQSPVIPEIFQQFLDPLMEDLGDAPPRFYLDWGLYDLRSTNEPVDTIEANRNLAAQLRDLGAEVAGGESPEGIGWANWSHRADKLFMALFPGPAAERRE